MDTARRELAGSIGLLVLRLGVGGYMLSHGVGKLQMVIGGEFNSFGDPIGLGSTLSLILVAFAEFFCSLLVMAGLFTRAAAAPIVFTMAVAAFAVHRNDPWTMGAAARLFNSGEAQHWGSKEPALLFLIVFLTLIFTGAGGFSLDAVIRRRRTARGG